MITKKTKQLYCFRENKKQQQKVLKLKNQET